MTNHGSGGERPLFSLAPGRHFDETVYDDVRDELKRKGWSSIAHTFDVEDGTKSLDDHAKQMAIAEEESGAGSVVRVGWSWGANVAIRKLYNAHVTKIILPAGAFDPNSLAWLDDPVPKTDHSVHYGAYENNSEKAAEDLIRTCLLTDISDEDIILSWARNLRPHPRRKDEPPLYKTPAPPIDYIRLLRDKAILNQPEIARALQKKKKRNVTILDFASDHMPMVSHPREFTQLLINRAMESS